MDSPGIKASSIAFAQLARSKAGRLLRGPELRAKHRRVFRFLGTHTPPRQRKRPGTRHGSSFRGVSRGVARRPIMRGHVVGGSDPGPRTPGEGRRSINQPNLMLVIQTQSLKWQAVNGINRYGNGTTTIEFRKRKEHLPRATPPPHSRPARLAGCAGHARWAR